MGDIDLGSRYQLYPRVIIKNRMKKEDLIKSIRQLMAIGDRDTEKLEVYPLRDWHIVLILFGIGFVCSVWYHMYLFMNINEDDFFVTTTAVTSVPVTFDSEKIVATIVLFNEQDTEFERLKVASTTIADPSR